MSEPKLREYTSHGMAVEAWWYKREQPGIKNIPVPVRSDNLKPAKLPIGLATTLGTLFKKLP